MRAAYDESNDFRRNRERELALMAGKFVITKDKKGEYRFALKAGNGEIIATSERYTTKAAARNGIESVKSNASDASIVDVTGE